MNCLASVSVVGTQQRLAQELKVALPAYESGLATSLIGLAVARLAWQERWELRHGVMPDVDPLYVYPLLQHNAHARYRRVCFGGDD